jgi:hypothetical protein
MSFGTTLLVILLGVVMLSVMMLNDVMLSVVMLSVMAPALLRGLGPYSQHFIFFVANKPNKLQ